jgi:hypothetical protein
VRVKLFSATGEPAVVGVGDHPIAIFAAGQFARGIFVTGQFAIGVVVLAQFGVSVWGVGQFGIGVGWWAGMFGLGGRGLCLRFIPGLDPPRDAPSAVRLESLEAGGADAEGFVRAEIVSTAQGACLGADGRPLPVKLTPKVAGALAAAAQRGRPREVLAHVKRAASSLVCDRLVEIPGQRAPYRLPVQLARLAALVVLGTAWWYAMYAG